MHAPVLLDEAIEALAIKPNGIYIDGTFGRGGHSQLILSRLDEQGKLIAFDKDVSAVAVGKMIQDKRFCIEHASFSQLQQKLQQIGIRSIDGVLLDLGVSSPQLEDASRGFSFRATGPLDMRMDVTKGLSAAEWIATVKEDELEWVIKEYGEERYAQQIARAIIVARTRQSITTTRELAEIVAGVVRSRQRQREIVRHPATRTFQAIRIFINQELEELSLTLPQCSELLNIGGRLVVISFHSLEDRMVKQFMRQQAHAPSIPRQIPLKLEELQRLGKQQLRLIGKIRPGITEIDSNPRARSAVMRVAEKLV